MSKYKPTSFPAHYLVDTENIDTKLYKEAMPKLPNEVKMKISELVIMGIPFTIEKNEKGEIKFVEYDDLPDEIKDKLKKE